MKRLLRFFARLYPPAWRNRYAAEFEALLDDRTPRLRDAFDVLLGAMKMQVTSQRFVRIVLPCAIAGALVAVAISFVIPKQYVSVTTFTGMSRLENGVCQNPDDLPAGLRGPSPGVCNDAATLDGFLFSLRQSFLNRDFLASEIQRRDLYARERAREPLDAVIAKMQRSIKVTPAGRPVDGTQNFLVAFDYPDPRSAQLVSHDLASQWMRKPGSLPPLPHVSPHSTHFSIGIDSHASLPTKPAGLSRIWLGVIGLFAGLLAGVLIATLAGSRRLRRGL